MQPTMWSVIVCPSNSFKLCNYHMDYFAELFQTFEIPDNGEWNISVSVNYPSGLNVYSNYHYLISMFTIVKFTVEPTNNRHLKDRKMSLIMCRHIGVLCSKGAYTEIYFKTQNNYLYGEFPLI